MEARVSKAPITETRFADGTRILTRRKKTPRAKTNHETAIHEGGHGGIGLLTGARVRLMSIIPGSNYLGVTIFESTPSPEATMAPKALGTGGTGSDEAQVKQQGHSVEGATSGAARMLADEEAQFLVEQLAAALVQYGTIGRKLIDEIFDDVRHGYEVEITIITPDGKEKRESRRVKHSDSSIFLTDLPKSTFNAPR